MLIDISNIIETKVNSFWENENIFFSLKAIVHSWGGIDHSNNTRQDFSRAIKDEVLHFETDTMKLSDCLLSREKKTM